MISNNKHYIDKSRLGRLLVSRGYISDAQLETALELQRNGALRLGEVLVSQGLISARDLERTLKHQTRTRYAAALVAAVVAPMQPLVAFAASAPANATIEKTTTTLEEFSARRGLKPLADDAMAGVSAQGLTEDVKALMGMVAGDEEKSDPTLKVAKTLTNVFVPITNHLEWDATVEGVTYDTSKPAFKLLASGKMELAFPTHIDKISLENLRVSGSSAPSFGNVYLSDISFAPESRLIISAR